VLYALTPNLQPKPHSFVFAASVQTSVSFSAAMTYYRMRGFTKLGVIATTDASGQNNLEGLRAILRLPDYKSMQIVDVESFGITDVSMAAQAVKLKESGAQVIFDYSEGTTFGTSLRALNDVGLSVPVYTPGSNFSPVLLNQLKSILPKEVDATGLSYVNRDRKAGDPQKKAIDEFYAALAADGVTQPTSTDAHAWDPASIVVTELRAVGTSATANLHNYPGVEGIYDFSVGDQHGVGVSSLLLVKSDPNNPGHPLIASKPGGAPL
jgi:branched-chain amino acid transport system substrate-binding protein